MPTFTAHLYFPVWATLSLSLNVSMCLSHTLSLSGTKPSSTLGAGAADFEAWLSLYHCLVT